MRDYTAWRITYQCSEQAARAAYRAAQQHLQHVENLRYAGNRVIRGGEGAHVWDLALKALPDDSPLHDKIEELEEQASQAAAERDAMKAHMEKLSSEAGQLSAHVIGIFEADERGDDDDKAACEDKALGGAERIRVLLVDAPDSTTASQGGETVPKWKFDAVVKQCELAEKARDTERQRLRELNEGDPAEAWRWMGDGNDHLESLTCPVLISAGALRSLIAEKQAEELDVMARLLRSLGQQSPADQCSRRAAELHRLAEEGR